MTTQPFVPAPAVREFLKSIADETRLDILRMLSITDLTAGEINARVDAPQNRVSYHLRRLRAAGLLRDRRSSQDARDVYYSVNLDRLQHLHAATGAALHPGLLAASAPSQPCLTAGEQPLRVLFLCTHNSARSQLAEALLQKMGGDAVIAHSAGSDPLPVHPITLQLLEEWGADSGAFVSKTIDRFVGQAFGYVITVCDRVREQCPEFSGALARAHWSLPDPLEVTDPQQQMRAFYATGAELATRIEYLLRFPRPAPVL